MLCTTGNLTTRNPQAKYDGNLEAAVRAWLVEVVKAPLSSGTALHELLKDGLILGSYAFLRLSICLVLFYVLTNHRKTCEYHVS